VPYCWPGHTKRDYRYSILELQPDVIQGWHGMQEPDILAFLQQNYVAVPFGGFQFLFKKGSSEISFSALPGSMGAN
jgi:hypothetical protein